MGLYVLDYQMSFGKDQKKKKEKKKEKDWAAHEPAEPVHWPSNWIAESLGGLV